MNIGIGLDIASGGGKPRYLFRDEFTTDRAAGAVNNTSCEPGPGGNRTTVETELATGFSIANGELVIPGVAVPVKTGSGSNLLEPYTVTRVAGKIFVARMYADAINANYTSPIWGLFSATPLSISNAIHYFGFINSQINVTQSQVCAVSTKTYYDMAIVLRSVGVSYYVLLNGAWRLVYNILLSNTATMYLGIAQRLDTASGKCGFIRIPAARWLPAPTVSDGFSAWGTSDGAGHAETTGIGSGGANVTWTGSTWAVSGGKASVSPCLGVELVTNGNMETGDPPTAWTSGGALPDSIADERTGGSGASSLAVIRSGGTYGRVYQAITTIANSWYSFSAWTKVVDGSVLRLGLVDHLDQSIIWAGYLGAYVTSTSWTRYFKVGRALSTNGEINFQLSAAIDGQSFRVDDVSLKQLYLPSLVSFPSQSSTANPWCEGVWSAKVDGTQWGYLTNCDTNFAATVSAAQAIGTTEITLTNVTKAITANDSLLDKANSILYGIASVGELSGTTQTITLDAPGLTAELAAGEVGIDYASWNGILTYYDGAGNCKCDQILNGTYTNLASTAITFSATARLIVRIGVGAATNIDIYHNEAKVGNTLTKDASITGKYHGLFSTDSGNTVDNFVVYATDGTTPLNAFIN